MFEFELSFEAERVLQEGIRMFNRKGLLLDKCALEVHCYKEGVKAEEALEKIMDFFIFLRDKDFF